MLRMKYIQGFPKKTPDYQKMKNMPDLLTDDRKGKRIEIIDLKYFRKRASFWETLYFYFA